MTLLRSLSLNKVKWVRGFQRRRGDLHARPVLWIAVSFTAFVLFAWDLAGSLNLLLTGEKIEGVVQEVSSSSGRFQVARKDTTVFSVSSVQFPESLFNEIPAEGETVQLVSDGEFSFPVDWLKSQCILSALICLGSLFLLIQLALKPGKG